MAVPGTRRAFLRSHRRGLIGATSLVVVLAVLATVAIVAQGFDVKQTPVESDSIWAINRSTDSDTTRYARVNTKLKELDTVKPVTDPTAIAQTASSVVLMTNSNAKYADIDLSNPQAFKTDSKDLKSAPSGAPQQVATTGDYVGYRTASNAVYVATMHGGRMSEPVLVDPYASDGAANEPQAAYAADVIGIGTGGILFSYSSKRDSVAGYDIASGTRVSDDPVRGVPEGALATLQLTVVGDAWVLFDGASTIWSRSAPGGAAVALPGGADAAAVLQQPSADGDAVYFASARGLYSTGLAGGATATAFAADGLGTPAVPTEFRGTVYAAWLPPNGTAGGTLFATGGRGRSSLGFGGKTEGASPEPVFRSNGGTMIVNDDANGWVWTVPDGALVPSSQNWAAGESTAQTSSDDTATAQDVVQPKPPVAEDDAFGVRPGQLVSLPVLLNDWDPNAADVLTVVPDSLDGLDGAFGTLDATTNDQRIAVRVAAGATGSASFSYTVTDGTSRSGDRSRGTVTLTIVGGATETAPIWCGDNDNGCTQQWPGLEVVPGGSGSVDALDQWVDPEGDALYVSSVTKVDPDDRGSVAATQGGSILFQDDDANDTAGGEVQLAVTVSDSRGMSTTKTLTVTVTPQPTLTAVPLAVTTHVGETLSIDPSPYISGAVGVYSVTQATAADSAAKAAVDASATGIDFSSSKAGTYVVRYDLTDTSGQLASSVARVTVLADADSGLATAPITVFVRPRLDSTVNVFSAVSNPANKLLLLADATSHFEGKNALHVDVVGHGLLRVTGSTADGQPGLVGSIDYTVTDGGSGPGSTARGVATVVLLPDQEAQRPIAVNDAVTVRAGSQVDIPVLANDVSVDGGAIVLDPDPASLTDSAAKVGGLAFVSGSKVRFLAPAQDGVYTIGYRVYAAGAPGKLGTGTVQVTVTKPGDNRDPRPGPLEARVVAGSTVQIPFDDYGVDPDGDSVVLDRIASQPRHGTATISSRGDQISYTAFADFVGSDQFDYQVRDAEGAVGTATVRVGVIGTDTGSTPITFTDYVEVQAGQSNVVDVYPAANDIDPLGGALTVTSVTPYATKGSPEYDELASLIDVTKTADGTAIVNGRVRLSAGTSVGTKTFTYDVTTADSLNPATGYIVLKVVADAVPDTPRVSDSYVSVDDRATFPTEGIDVVTNKVSWLSGDVGALTLELRDPPAGYTQDGLKIRGPLPDDSLLLAFKVTGTSYFTKKPVSSYGFLRIPGKNDVILALAANAKQQSVKENGPPITFDMASLVSIPPGSTLVVDGASVTKVRRPAAECSLVSATTIRYTPHAGGPYTDACLVPVKIDGQKFFTSLLVPIKVVPEKPVPTFKAASLSDLIPGPDDKRTFDLTKMVSWQGADDAAHLAFAVDRPSAKKFDFSQSGNLITVRAKAGTNPGTKATVTVHFAGTYASVGDVGVINLTVGQPPPNLPKGGSTSAVCDLVLDGDCQVTVVGLAGEFNYNKVDGRLKVVQSVGDSACPGIRFSVYDGTEVVADWDGDPDGIECQTSFVVQDPAGQKSSGDRNGTIRWQFQGRPRPPASVAQVGYGDGSISLAVTPGRAADAFPKLTGFVIKQDRRRVVAKCDARGECPDITGLTNLEHHLYFAYAVNGKNTLSDDSAVVEAWAYARPSLGTVQVTPVYDPSLTDPKRGVARIVIRGSAASVSGYKISGNASVVQRTGDLTTVDVRYPVGPTTIKITPVTSSDPPPGKGPDAEDAAGSFVVRVAGPPRLNGTIKATGDTASITVSGLTPDANGSDKPVQVYYAAYLASAPTCAVDADGGTLQITGGDGAASADPALTGLQHNKSYTVFVCASNGYGLVQSATTTAFTTTVPSTPPPFTYTVAVTPTNTASGALYRLSVNEGDVRPTDPATTTVWTNWNKNTDTAAITGSDPQISVQYCLIQFPTVCGPTSTATAAPGSAPFQLLVSGATGSAGLTCDAAAQTLTGMSVSGMGDASLGTISITGVSYYDKDDHKITPTDLTTVPTNARYVKGVAAKLVWDDTKADAALDDYAWNITTSSSQKIDCANYVDTP